MRPATLPGIPCISLGLATPLLLPSPLALRLLTDHALASHWAVPMPDHCPMYYWLELSKLPTAPVPTREPSFLDNLRTPSTVRSSVAHLRLCRNTPCSSKELPPSHGTAPEVLLPGTASVPELLRGLRATADARVLRVHHMHALAPSRALLHASELSVADHVRTKGTPSTGAFSSRALGEITRGFWCTACPITRRGAVIHEHNRFQS